MYPAQLSSSARDLNQAWITLGGSISDIRRTGEIRYDHPSFTSPLRTNKRRKDGPRALNSRIRKLLQRPAANDCEYK